ncbi:hypothetical protein IWQ60_011803 [Tieghemiomyces parasiticus]|uniref:Uncharacterized protein n=1 Tax=Tieghemiomyces parasiticus TaxID=78921 RepID=A0A9W8DI45_9FUNG|nr:hypothetical protein IWQ60_011803 [Tieghemiomyces parasiticus]
MARTASTSLANPELTWDNGDSNTTKADSGRLKDNKAAHDEVASEFANGDFQNLLPVIKQYIETWFVQDVIILPLRESGYTEELEKFNSVFEQLTYGYYYDNVYSIQGLPEKFFELYMKRLNAYLPYSNINSGNVKHDHKARYAARKLLQLDSEEMLVKVLKKPPTIGSVDYFIYLVRQLTDEQLIGLLKYFASPALKKGLETVSLDTIVNRNLLTLAQTLFTAGGEEQIRQQVVAKLPESLVAAVLTLRLSNKDEALDPSLQLLFSDTTVISDSNRNLGWGMAVQLGYPNAAQLFPADPRISQESTGFTASDPDRIHVLRTWHTRMTCSAVYHWRGAAEAAFRQVRKWSYTDPEQRELDLKCRENMRDGSPFRLSSSNKITWFKYFGLDEAHFTRPSLLHKVFSKFRS